MTGRARGAELYREPTSQENNPTRIRQASVSAALAAARAEASATLAAGSLASGRLSSGNLSLATQAAGNLATGVRFPGEDGGRSLGEMAQRDLDAALQLLADRAQYITGASGAAIALRRDGKNDMLCRASAGSNAPELGALLSTEFGLSGESVRTRQALRCDDAERDARVNREVCRQLGIASVVVMPVVNDDEVLGVFELFSGEANAFGARDVSAIQRLSEMVETAVRLAQATASLPERLKMREISGPGSEEVGFEEVRAGEAYVELPEDRVLEGQVVGDLVVPDMVLRDPVPQDALAEEEPVLEVDVAAEHEAERLTAAEAEAVTAEKRVIAAPDELKAEVPALSREAQPEKAAVAAAAVPRLQAEPVPAVEAAPAKKPLFWSAAMSSAADADQVAEPDQSHVPPVLRSLHKCEACGFPVSSGRVLCVECEEKKWRGQLKIAPAARRQGAMQGPAAVAEVFKAEAKAFAAGAQSAAASAPAPARENVSPAVATSILDAVPLPAARSADAAPEFILSAGLPPSQSWLAANKYVVGVILLVAAAAAAAFFLLR